MEQNPVAEESESPKHWLRQYGVAFALITIMVLGKLIGNNEPHDAIALFGTSLDFIIFVATLTLIALKEKLKLEPRDIALSGLSLVLAHHLYIGTDFLDHFTHDHGHGRRIVSMGNIGALLLGFAVVSKCFERFRLGEWLPAILPDDWRGAAILLSFILVLSAFLDNIAAALIGFAIARKVFQERVTVGYVAAIVACSNAGGAPSVVGDTTTTMMWLKGVSPLDVLHAGVGTLGAGAIVIYFAARQQDKYQRILKDPAGGLTFADLNWSYFRVVFLALAGCITGNLLIDLPAVGLWIGLVIGGFLVGFTKMPYGEITHAAKEAVFLLSLVAMAGLMPVKELPDASAIVAFVVGIGSSGFDNIPLTEICLSQGGYDWGVLAYAVGYGGSMTWFGSSAGVAVCAKDKFPEGKDVFAWIKQGWFVPVGYVVGYALMIGTVGWNPHELKKQAGATDPSVATPTSATAVVQSSH